MEGRQEIVLAAICLLPTLVEGYFDRRGEDKKGKQKDLIWSVVGYLTIASGAWWLGKSPLSTLALLFGWRILIFDYMAHWLLIRNDVIVGNWWSYHGKTSRVDLILANVHWLTIMIVKVVVFIGACLLFAFN